LFDLKIFIPYGKKSFVASEIEVRIPLLNNIWNEMNCKKVFPGSNKKKKVGSHYEPLLIYIVVNVLA